MKNICRNSKDTKLKCIQIRIHIFEEKYIHIYSWKSTTHTHTHTHVSLRNTNVDAN